jgi:type II secretory pathway pseudopilin PulG
MTTSRARRCSSRAGQRGVALLLVLVLVITIGLAALFGRSSGDSQRFTRDQATDAALIQAKAALIGYAATYRDTHDGEIFGYLPCPDFTGDGAADTMTNGCAGSANGKATVGLLPFMTLGLADLRDREGVCLWYAVSGKFKAAGNKPKPMNWDTQGQFEVRDAGGAVLLAPNDASGGAAAVIIASGLPLPAQNRTANAGERCQINPAEVSAYLDGAYDFATTATINLVAGPVIDAGGKLTNNDRLAWITPKEIFDTVKKRSDFSGPLPSGHLNRLIADLTIALTAGASLPDPSTAATVGSGAAQRLVGGLPAGLAVAADLQSYRDNWSDQFRYLKCSSGTACLNSGACAGALIFAGERAAGGPRSATEATAIASFLEGDRLGVWNGSSDTFTINSDYSATVPTMDVARCLNATGGGPGGGPGRGGAN